MHLPYADLLAELRRREKELGVEVDWAVNAMMKAGAIEGGKHSVVTEFVIHMLGLEICADTIIGNAMKRGVSGGQRKRVTSGAHLRSHRSRAPIKKICCPPVVPSPKHIWMYPVI
jgi:hypothetical protein